MLSGILYSMERIPRGRCYRCFPLLSFQCSWTCSSHPDSLSSSLRMSHCRFHRGYTQLEHKCRSGMSGLQNSLSMWLYMSCSSCIRLQSK